MPLVARRFRLPNRCPSIKPSIVCSSCSRSAVRNQKSPRNVDLDMTLVRGILTTSVFVLASALAATVRYAPEARAQGPELTVPRTKQHASSRDVGVKDFRVLDA